MNGKGKDEFSYRSLLLLEELSKEEALSQRDLSRRLGIALGLVNSYIRNMIARGYVRVRAFPRQRYTYLLTPKGFAEKSRLTYQHLHYFTNLYTNVRKDFSALFRRLEAVGVKRVLFCGVDEVAEIACLSLQETNIELSGIVDATDSGKRFFRHTISPVEALDRFACDRIIITSLKKGDSLREILKKAGVTDDMICRVDDR